MEEGPPLRSSLLPPLARRTWELMLAVVLQGFWARPQKTGDALNLLQWDVGIPGKEGVSRRFSRVGGEGKDQGS